MPDFDLTGELSLKIELHMLRPITEKVHSGNGPVSLVLSASRKMGTDFTANLKSYRVTNLLWLGKTGHPLRAIVGSVVCHVE